MVDRQAEKWDVVDMGDAWFQLVPAMTYYKSAQGPATIHTVRGEATMIEGRVVVLAAMHPTKTIHESVAAPPLL